MSYYPLPPRLRDFCDVYGRPLKKIDLLKIEHLAFYTFESTFSKFLGENSGGCFYPVSFFENSTETLRWSSVLDFLLPTSERRAIDRQIENFFHVCEDYKIQFLK